MVPQIDLCQDGPRFSRLVHGLWRLADWKHSVGETADLINQCLAQGITTFDHADIYGEYTCEGLFGPALAECGVDRSAIQIVTKCGIKLVSANRPAHTGKSYDTSRDHIVTSVETSLKNLRTEYIDLLLIHRPDPLLDPEDVNAAFVSLRDAGKVRHFGVSNFLPSQFEMLAAHLEVPLVTNQIEYSVLQRGVEADGSIDLCLKRGIRPMAWSPFGGGRLFHEDSAQAKRVRETLHEIGRDLGGASLDQVALAWVLRHPAAFLPVLGTGKASRIKKAVEALDLTLSREQWFQIWQASAGHDIP